MDTINNDLTNLLQQMGVHQESLGITQRIVMIAGILIIAFVADYFCRKIIVPTIKNNILYITVSLVDLIAVDKLLKKNLKFL